MDLKARAAVANTAARKPINWNDGSVPAQQSRGHAAGIICVFDRCETLTSFQKPLLQCNIGTFSPVLFSALSYDSITCCQHYASNNWEEREIHAAWFYLPQHDESQNGCAQGRCRTNGLHDVDHLFAQTSGSR